MLQSKGQMTRDVKIIHVPSRDVLLSLRAFIRATMQDSVVWFKSFWALGNHRLSSNPPFVVIY